MELSSSKLVELPKVDIPTVVAPAASNWICSTFFPNRSGQPITSFVTTWIVPPPPRTQSGQLLYLFNGLQDSGNNVILQPVLQWGDSGVGGGNYWAIANWFVIRGKQKFTHDPIQVNPGDTLVGVITQVNGPAGFNYTSTFQGFPASTLVIGNIAQLVNAFETLECYRILQCSDYPPVDKTQMVSIGFQPAAVSAAVNWTPNNRVIDCGQHAVVVRRALPPSGKT